MRNPATAPNTRKGNGGAGSSQAKTRNGKSLNGSSAERGRQIQKLLKQRNWPAAQAALHEALIFEPADHWLWMHLGLCYYEQHDYEKALKCCEHAVRLEPQCSLAMWHYAGALAMAGHPSAALGIWTGLLTRDLDEIAYGEHGEGMAWAFQLVNDVHFRMARCYQQLGQRELAQQAFAKYLHNRAHGVGSLYEVAVAEGCLKELQSKA